MSFTNAQVDLETLPRFDAVELQRVDPRYPGIVLGLVGGFELFVLLAAGVVVMLIPEARTALSAMPLALVPLGIVGLAALLAAYSYKAASVIRYAVREHDVILHSGVFFKREVIQPIRRLQHVEQTQGPVARRFGLAKIRLFSAGTAHFAFEIPGLDAATALRMRQSILTLRESKLAGTPAAGPAETAGVGTAEPSAAGPADAPSDG